MDGLSIIGGQNSPHLLASHASSIKAPALPARCVSNAAQSKFGQNSQLLLHPPISSGRISTNGGVVRLSLRSIGIASKISWAGGLCTTGRSFATFGICSVSSKRGDIASPRMNCIPPYPISQSSPGSSRTTPPFASSVNPKADASIQPVLVRLSWRWPHCCWKSATKLSAHSSRSNAGAQHSAIRINATRRSGDVSCPLWAV